MLNGSQRLGLVPRLVDGVNPRSVRCWNSETKPRLLTGKQAESKAGLHAKQFKWVQELVWLRSAPFMPPEPIPDKPLPEFLPLLVTAILFRGGSFFFSPPSDWVHSEPTFCWRSLPGGESMTSFVLNGCLFFVGLWPDHPLVCECDGLKCFVCLCWCFSEKKEREQVCQRKWAEVKLQERKLSNQLIIWCENALLYHKCCLLTHWRIFNSAFSFIPTLTET